MQGAALVRFLEARMGGSRGTSPEIQFHCPFCLDRKGGTSHKMTLRVNIEKRMAICYRCDYRAGTLVYLVQSLRKGAMTAADIAELSGGRREETEHWRAVRDVVQLAMFPPSSRAAAVRRGVPLPPEYKPLSECDARCRGWKYLTRRGYSAADAARFRIGYCATGRYALRLIFPVTQGGEDVYFANRMTNDVCEPKSLNHKSAPNEIGKTDCLLNYDAVVGQSRIEIAEGPFSAMALPHAVALMGKTLSAVQARLIAALCAWGLEEVCVCVDADANPTAIVEMLVGRVPRVTWVELGSGDPDENRTRIGGYLARRKAYDLPGQLRRTISASQGYLQLTRKRRAGKI